MSSGLVILFTILLSALFSGMEIAYISANRLQLELDKKQGRISSRFISVFNKFPARYLTTMLVGNNVALVIYSIFMAAILRSYIIMFVSNELIILFVQTVISTLLILLVAEFLPKLIFRSFANQMLNFLSFPVFIVFILFYPVTVMVDFFSQMILKTMKGESPAADRNSNVFSKIDLLYFINQSNHEEQENKTQTNEIKLFQNALDFSSVRVRDCMVPRTEIAALPEDAKIDEFRNVFITTGFSKILVYKEKVDNILGYVTSKALFASSKVSKLPVIEVSFVPETMPANKLLKKLIQDKKSIAVVIDEFGGVSGMLTIEDIMEEIFGEIEDEYDTSELVEKQLSESEFIFSGRLEIEYLNEAYNLNIPELEDFETLAGFILHHNESIPKPNEVVVVGKFEFKILKASVTKVELVHLQVME
jgi:CBS domain containing-hemolysin-like protein